MNFASMVERFRARLTMPLIATLGMLIGFRASPAVQAASCSAA